ncbi:MAG: metallophosphoesterase [Clostridia bacterium]|jgi:serine/threonine protein phosphatase 1|nr:metallophosphoesterase [Clostridia bacterium]MBO7503837.1 metallophosphoesterase [Clostridia bacterium]MBP5665600.1 metallophosphoesterase [Clostridia bacterium]MBP5765845.1 metallophosphoesterase [Clostridia bacterium]
MKYYVVSDIHSFLTPLRAALKEAGYFSDPEPHKLVVCGDIFDRGSEPLETEQFICRLLERDEVIIVRGNHEDLMLSLLEDAEVFEGTSVILHSHYAHNGTVRTLQRFTGASNRDICERPAEIVAKMRKTEYIRTIIPAARDWFETENYIFVHGWIPCREANEMLDEPVPTFREWRKASRLDWECARWMDYVEVLKRGLPKPEKTVICGHRSASYGHDEFEKPVPTGKGKVTRSAGSKGNVEESHFRPFYGDGLIAIDACTVLSGVTNCIVIED